MKNILHNKKIQVLQGLCRVIKIGVCYHRIFTHNIHGLNISPVSSMHYFDSG
jgi:hypothetical protein